MKCMLDLNNVLKCKLFILSFRPLTAMCTDRLELQDCLEHGRTAKVLAACLSIHIMFAYRCTQKLSLAAVISLVNLIHSI